VSDRLSATFSALAHRIGAAELETAIAAELVADLSRIRSLCVDPGTARAVDYTLRLVAALLQIEKRSPGGRPFASQHTDAELLEVVAEAPSIEAAARGLGLTRSQVYRRLRKCRAPRALHEALSAANAGENASAP